MIRLGEIFYFPILLWNLTQSGKYFVQPPTKSSVGVCQHSRNISTSETWRIHCLAVGIWADRLLHFRCGSLLRWRFTLFNLHAEPVTASLNLVLMYLRHEEIYFESYDAEHRYHKCCQGERETKEKFSIQLGDLINQHGLRVSDQDLDYFLYPPVNQSQ